jgi:hypothetical protein
MAVRWFVRQKPSEVIHSDSVALTLANLSAMQLKMTNVASSAVRPISVTLSRRVLKKASFFTEN